MAHNDSQIANENTHNQTAGSEDDSMDIGDNTLDATHELHHSEDNKPDRSRRKSISPKSNYCIQENPLRESSSQESYMQDIPLDFSMPKRKDDRNSLNNSPKHEIRSPFISSSPPRTMFSGRNTSSDLYNECGRNGSVSPPNLHSERITAGPSDSISNSESVSTSLANGQLIDPRMSPDFLTRERSHSFSASSLHNKRRHVLSHRQSRNTVLRGSGQVRGHHINDSALMSSIVGSVGYADFISQQPPPGCTSPVLANMQNMTTEEVLRLYKDHMNTLQEVEKQRYTFLASGVPSCVAGSVSGNSMIASLPNMLVSSMPTSAGRHHNATVSAAATITTNYTSSNTTPPSYSSSSSSSSSSNSTIVTTTPAKRRPRSLPDNQKDEAYWERRRKNNEAAKRSRDARRLKEEEIAMRASFLEQENLKLKVEVASLKTETAKLKCLLFNS